MIFANRDLQGVSYIHKSVLLRKYKVTMCQTRGVAVQAFKEKCMAECRSLKLESSLKGIGVIMEKTEIRAEKQSDCGLYELLDITA